MNSALFKATQKEKTNQETEKIDKLLSSESG